MYRVICVQSDLLGCPPQVLLVDDGVALEHGHGTVAADAHGHVLRDRGHPHHLPPGQHGPRCREAPDRLWPPRCGPAVRVTAAKKLLMAKKDIVWVSVVANRYLDCQTGGNSKTLAA